MLPRVEDFPSLFGQYRWDSCHAAFGWPPDCLQTGFPWLVTLEDRFKAALEQVFTLPVTLVAEMILWGGNQNNVLGKFSKGLRSTPYDAVIGAVIDNLDDPSRALESALAIEGFGLTYSSKLLRFCRPAVYGALDGRIRDVLGDLIGRIYDGKTHSMCAGYMRFLNLLSQYQRDLGEHAVVRPSYGSRTPSAQWTAAEVEMALFAWASH